MEKLAKRWLKWTIFFGDVSVVLFLILCEKAISFKLGSLSPLKMQSLLSGQVKKTYG